MLHKNLIGKEVEITVGDYAGVWGYIKDVYKLFDDEYYAIFLWNNSDYCYPYKIDSFKVIE